MRAWCPKVTLGTPRSVVSTRPILLWMMLNAFRRRPLKASKWIGLLLLTYSLSWVASLAYLWLDSERLAGVSYTGLPLSLVCLVPLLLAPIDMVLSSEVKRRHLVEASVLLLSIALVEFWNIPGWLNSAFFRTFPTYGVPSLILDVLRGGIYTYSAALLLKKPFTVRSARMPILLYAVCSAADSMLNLGFNAAFFTFYDSSNLLRAFLTDHLALIGYSLLAYFLIRWHKSLSEDELTLPTYLNSAIILLGLATVSRGGFANFTQFMAIVQGTIVVLLATRYWSPRIDASTTIPQRAHDSGAAIEWS